MLGLYILLLVTYQSTSSDSLHLMHPSSLATSLSPNSPASPKVLVLMHSIVYSIKPWGRYFIHSLLQVRMVSWWLTQMQNFAKFFQFLPLMSPTIPSSASLRAAMSIGAQNALCGGPSMKKTKSQHREQKIHSKQLCNFEKTVRTPSNMIWRVFERSTHLSGRTSHLPTYSWRLHHIFCINCIRESSRTIWLNSVPVFSGKNYRQSIPCHDHPSSLTPF